MKKINVLILGGQKVGKKMWIKNIRKFSDDYFEQKKYKNNFVKDNYELNFFIKNTQKLNTAEIDEYDYILLFTDNNEESKLISNYLFQYYSMFFDKNKIIFVFTKSDLLNSNESLSCLISNKTLYNIEKPINIIIENINN